MSEKALHNFIIFVLLVAVVLLGNVASKSEHFAGGVSGDRSAQLSARLRGEGATIGSLPARLRGEGATIGSLPARLRGSGQKEMGAVGLTARIQTGSPSATLPTLEHFRGAIPDSSGLAARLREASNGAMPTNASDKTGHDNKATKMAIVPAASKLTIMSNLTTK